MTLEEWLRSHPFLEPVADVRRRIDAAVNAVTTPLPVAPDWDEYAEDFAAGVPLLRSQTPIDLEPAGDSVVAVIHRLASDGGTVLAEDASALAEQLREDPSTSLGAGRLASRRIIGWLMGHEKWDPARAGLLRSLGWITLSSALEPLVEAFTHWRDDGRWLRRYCPTCGSPPAMAQLVGSDPGRRRLLSCGCCKSRWRFPRNVCPFCEAESHRLSIVTVEGQGGLRIDYCESCKGYVKTYAGEGNEAVLLADWTSIHLDLVASDRRLKRQAVSLYDFEPPL